jgi:hypothetical protein
MNNLSKNIWVTRKCRILASERLANYDLIAQIIVNYYAIFLVALAIWDLYEENNDLSLAIVIGSIMVATTSLFISSRNFKERSLILKNCYTKLNAMCRYVERLENDNKYIDLIESEKEYDMFINNFENHHDIDYLRFKYNIHFNKNNVDIKLSITEWSKFILINIYMKTICLLLFALPILIIMKIMAMN